MVNMCTSILPSTHTAGLVGPVAVIRRRSRQRSSDEPQDILDTRHPLVDPTLHGGYSVIEI